MVTRNIFRGDDYPVYRPVYRYALVRPEIDPATNQPYPFDMSGCTVLATFKPLPTDPAADPDDEEAIILAEIKFNGDGSIAMAENFSLPPGHTAEDGVLHLTLDRTLTRTIQTGLALKSDLKVTDALDHDQTVPVVGQLVAMTTFTNRR